ncbi:MAG: tRNA (adenosine(37)-N6)-dimethylallyltransferase MiaA [Alphaproteobacteria bacterium]|nr:tRNA (adenosine(37)-N6)-dimethylallyltransferase MiaA [Alphaproteobacteria bacterium]
MKHSAYIITGPTASGKSNFAHHLARRVDGTIINCDSVQIYRGIENISASPFANRPITDCIDDVPYRLFSILPLTEQISVAQYLDMARHEYNNAISANRTPIFVGGTGYYINALINGISPMPDVSAENRIRARQMVAENIDVARSMLPVEFTATDPQRVARAVEVFLQTGRHLTEFQDMPRVGAVIPNAFRILINPPTDILRYRIANRIPEMLSGGAMTEAQRIIDSGWDERRAIGAGQLCALLRGEKSQQDCITDWINKTNQYAKRQRTWFRTQFNPDIVIDYTPTETDIELVV